MKTVRFVADHGDHKAGQVLAVDDQLAVDAIAHGVAVPSIDLLPPGPARAAPTVIEHAKVPDAEHAAPPPIEYASVPSAERAPPENVAAKSAPETKAPA